MISMLAVVGVTVMLLGGDLAPTTPASTLPPTIDVSGDGTVYTREFGDLFEGTVLVPRATEVDGFTVRNTSHRTVYLRVVLADVDGTSDLLLDSLTLQITGAGLMSEATTLSEAAPCRELVTGVPLRAGAALPVDALVALADLDGTQAQRETARFSIHIVATEQIDRPGQTACAAAPPGATPPTDIPHQPPQLGVTGGALPLLGMILGVTLSSFGAFLVARRRSARRLAATETVPPPEPETREHQ